MDLYKNKYRIETTRLKGWDYSSPGYYFVTICTRKKECVLGEVIDGKVCLTEIGEIARQCWLNIPGHFTNVEPDEFIIMPNHVHGIIIIARNVETQHLASPGKRGVSREFKSNEFGPQSTNLGSIIRGFKIGVKKYANARNLAFAWQARFYDHIIRDEMELQRIRQYIRNNPGKWEEDEYYPAK